MLVMEKEARLSYHAVPRILSTYPGDYHQISFKSEDNFLKVVIGLSLSK